MRRTITTGDSESSAQTSWQYVAIRVGACVLSAIVFPIGIVGAISLLIKNGMDEAKSTSFILTQLELEGQLDQ